MQTPVPPSYGRIIRIREVIAMCHDARIALYSVFSKERAIQLVFLAGRDPLIGSATSTIVQRLGRLTGSKFKDRKGWNAAWLRKHRTTAIVEDTSIRKELRNLMRKREVIFRAKSGQR